MYSLIDALTKKCPSVALFAGGGKITITEMLQNVSQKREMIVITGSEGSSDAVTLKQNIDNDKSLTKITAEGRITPFAIDQSSHDLTILLQKRLQFHKNHSDKESNE